MSLNGFLVVWCNTLVCIVCTRRLFAVMITSIAALTAKSATWQPKLAMTLWASLRPSPG